MVERLLGKLNSGLGRRDGATRSSIADRDGYPSETRACLTFADLERCVALAIIDHNGKMNEKTLRSARRVAQPRRRSAADRGRAGRGSPELSARAAATADAQGVELFALHYYAPWLGVLVPERDRLGRLEIRYDPRDISRVYVRDPSDGQFRVTPRRDGNTDPR